MNKDVKKVSIVLPTFNGAKYLKKSIDSCLNQTYENIELVVVDDGSTDETAKIVDSYNDKRLKYIKHTKNRGLPQALNTGFANTQGEYLTWTSDDNQYLPTAIEEMKIFLDNNRDAGFVYADYWAQYLETGFAELRQTPNTLNLAETNDVGACFLYTRQVYDTIGNYDPKFKLVEDYDYWMRVSKKFKMIHYPQPLYIYGEHSNSLKSTKHIAIVLFGGVLKYKRNYISFAELRKSIEKSFVEDNFVSFPMVPDSYTAVFSPKGLFHTLQAIVKISRISLFLCLLHLSLMFQLTLAMVKSYLTGLVKYPFEYFDYLFLLRPKKSQIKINTDKKNILCITQSMVMGGAEQVILNIAEGTDKSKFSFHLVTTLLADNVWREKFENSFANIFPYSKRNKNMYYYNTIYYNFLQSLVKKLGINIILITNSVIGYEYVSRLKSDFKSIKIIDIIHAEYWPPSGLIVKLTPYFDRRICISQKLRNSIVEKYRKIGLDEKYIQKIKVIYNGIDTEKYSLATTQRGRIKAKLSIPENYRLISFIGRFSEEKNPSLFVKIAKRLVEKSPVEVKFVMAGDGYQLEMIKKMIKEYGLKDNFFLLGKINDVAELLVDTYVLLITSKIEGIPFAVLEAMNLGVPVISTNVGAVSEVIENNSNGFLIDSNIDVIESFVDRILDFLQGKVSHEKFSSKAVLAISPRFTLKAMTAKYQRTFDELIRQ